MNTALIDIAELQALRGTTDLVVVDCRFILGHAEIGRAAYLEAHINGAVYADLETDLSALGPHTRGRHPLPTAERMSLLFGRLGIGSGTRVVVYDDSFGMFAGRLWWMLRYLGHDDVAILDGAWQAWVGAGGEVSSGAQTLSPRRFAGLVRADRLVTMAEIEPDMRLLDAREAARYRGESETLDPRAGHIPGAFNHFWKNNIGPDGYFLAPEILRQQLTESLGILPDADVVHYCGSGVSACHNVLAQVHAGLPEPRLYCGSWSEWSRDDGRAIAIGGESRR